MNVTFDAQKFGKAVYNRRVDEDETLRSLSDRIDISPATISRVEKFNVPDIRTLSVLCGWLRVPPNRFFTVVKTE
jgi:transcriptional regulator with XRE-family HTH domain